MNPEYTEIDWIAEQLPDVPEPDELATARARKSLMTHVGDPARDTDIAVAVSAREHRWRRNLQLGVVGAGIAAAAFIGINLTGSGSGGGPAAASAANIKARVLAVLQPAPGSIQEVDEVRSATYSNHPSSTSEYHVWSELGGARTSRIVQKYSNGPTSEDEEGQTFQEIYDSFNNTIYRINHAGTTGGFIAGVADPIIQQMQNPGAVVDNSATFNGQPAIKITTNSTTNVEGNTYAYTTVTFVAPGTFQPLQTTSSTVGTQDGQQFTNSGTETFPVWRTLTGSAASPALVSLSAQHPSASTKVVDQTTFNQVDKKIHPRG